MNARIGILGLGEIGGTAARLLLSEEYAVSAVDRPNATWLVGAGGTLVHDAASLAGTCDIVISALSSEGAVEEAVFGPDGLVAGAHSALTVADMGTFAIALKERVRDALQKNGAVALDTPISGTAQAMETGRAVIMLSGDEVACETVRTVLGILAPNTPYVGPFGHGMKLKFVLNALVTNHVLVAAEALNMGIASGLDPQQIIDVVKPSVATSTQFELRGPLIAERKWDDPTAPARLVHKDTRYIVEHAEALGVPAPVSTITRDLYERVAEMGLLEKELSIIFEALAANNTLGK
ncbi:MAG: hypothetical protein CL573_09255 [Alphaproteobacteria bacterium]|nr:hypothetical protein [Alphaproteobacteria bacterium]